MKKQLIFSPQLSQLNLVNILTITKEQLFFLIRGKNRKALFDFNKVLEIRPEFLQARLRRGKVFVALGEYNKASNDFKNVITEKPDHEVALQQLSIISMLEQKLKEGLEAVETNNYNIAKDLFSAIIEVSGDSIEARIGRAKCNYFLKDYNSVLEDTMRVLKVNQIVFKLYFYVEELFIN